MSSSGVIVAIKNCYLVQGPMNKDYILYAVEIRTQRYMWTVFRRFTAFQRLYQILIQEGVPNIPPCPNKVMIYSNSGAVLDQRRQELEHWLKELLQNPYVQHVGAFQEFMRAEANIPPPNIKEVDLNARIEDPNPQRYLQQQQQQQQLQQQSYYQNYGYRENSNYESSPSNLEDIKDNTNSISLANFQIIKVIGKGSFGKVFQVCKKGTNEIYAMKVLKKSCIEKKHQIEHTKTERSILGKVTHPFIVNLRYAFQTTDKLYFVMDFCSGGELFYHLGKERKFSIDRAKYYAAEITLAIEHLHKNGVIYRDLKPENVLLTEEGHVCLTDFGLSKEGIHSPYAGAKSFCGTPEYLAPEILNRTGHGQAVDWWSLGALLYEMLTGWPPFYSKDQERLFNKIKKAPLEIPANIPSDAKDLLIKLLERDVSKRLGSGPGDAEEIKSHPFFSNIQWDLLLKKQLPVPWVPPVQNSTDTSQFSTEFTALPLVSPSSLNQSLHSDIKFQDFSYVSSLVNDTYANQNNENLHDDDNDMDIDEYDNDSDLSDSYDDGNYDLAIDSM